MAEIIDILMPLETGCSRFTVNHAAAGGVVPITNPPAMSFLYNASIGSFFSKGDSFIILTFGVILPLSFQFDRQVNVGNIPPRVTLQISGYGETTNLDYNFQELAVVSAGGSSGSYFYMIMENFDTPLDVFVDIPNEPPITGHSLISERFRLKLSLFNLLGYNISMVNVPAALDGTVQYIVPYVKILHNTPLAEV